MEKFIKDNLAYLLLVVIVFLGGIYLVYNVGSQAWNNMGEVKAKKEELTTKQQKLEQIRQQKMMSQKTEKKEVKSGKVIYEVLGQQFSAEASFGIMFENILANMSNSGIRIRSIDYNYSPADDLILQTNTPGYNACELSFVAVSTYTQLQTFLKNLAKENYLTSISEIYIEPYDKDKTILISRFKIRLYTKTI